MLESDDYQESALKKAQHEVFVKALKHTIINCSEKDVLVLHNKAPKNLSQYGIFGSVILNNDAKNMLYDVVPRQGAFEISFRGKLIFSKLEQKRYPTL